MSFQEEIIRKRDKEKRNAEFEEKFKHLLELRNVQNLVDNHKHKKVKIGNDLKNLAE